ncbi:MAG: DNRLRE domain-containing protein [Phycisphaeraceae bacterium]|nr:DNRLRE domain-containing protein [Phycisphaeraceae bacterium]
MIVELRKAVLVGLVAAGWFAAQAMATSVDIETHKDNSVYRDNTTAVLDYNDLGGGLLNLDCNNGALTYAAFDLSALPAGAVITGAQVGVFDQRTSNSGFPAFVSLVDVADDWDEATLDWNTAAASYYCTTGIEQNGATQNVITSMVNVSRNLWQGRLAMNAVPADMVWSSSRPADNLYVGTDTYHGGVAWEDAELLNNLNLIFSSGDKIPVFTFSCVYGKNQYFAERNSSDGPGATLRLEYDVIHAGDANNDGMVNLSDLQILGDNWQAAKVSWANADFTFDGVVNLADLQILGDNWGFGTSADIAFDEALALAGLAIPEPASMSLLALALPLVLRRRVNR